MNTLQYTALTGRTESLKSDLPYDQEGKSPIREQKIFAMRVVHHAMGIVTESGELMENCQYRKFDRVNTVEELGDLSWYISRMCEVMGVTMEELVKDSSVVSAKLSHVYDLSEIAGRISVEAANLMDCVKRFFFYGKPLDKTKLLAHLTFIMIGFLRACELVQVPPEKVYDINIAKLIGGRYKDVFSDVAANMRDLATERKILEEEMNKSELVPSEQNPKNLD